MLPQLEFSIAWTESIRRKNTPVCFRRTLGAEGAVWWILSCETGMHHLSFYVSVEGKTICTGKDNFKWKKL